jgi:hypothetical protein
VNSSDERGPARKLPDLVEPATDSADSAEGGASPSGAARPPLDSVTEVNGTVARFEMAYSPRVGERIAFGPPLRQMLPSFIFVAFAVFVVALVVAAHVGSSNTRLYIWLIEGDRGRPIGSSALSFLVLVSALGTVIRARMRGVVVHADGLEARYLLPMGLPRIKRWAWPQVERIVMDDSHVMLELWDGTYERLADVAETAKLGEMLERIAASRKIRVTRLPKLGGAGGELP